MSGQIIAMSTKLEEAVSNIRDLTSGDKSVIGFRSKLKNRGGVDRYFVIPRCREVKVDEGH